VLSPAEKQIVMLAVASFNDCHYCTAAHRTAGNAMGVPQAELEAIDDRRLPTDPRSRALVETAWTILSERGWVSDATLAHLGVSRAEAFEIIALIALKTITNYVNHIQGTEIDAPSARRRSAPHARSPERDRKLPPPLARPSRPPDTSNSSAVHASCTRAGVCVVTAELMDQALVGAQLRAACGRRSRRRACPRGSARRRRGTGGGR
jgi:AhpD family alkylhydroperoxidase